MAKRGHYDDILSELFTQLWDCDVNRCEPGSDYTLDLQGYVTTTNLAAKDWASRRLFATFDEERVFAQPTYRAFRALLDNYESDTKHPETVTEQEERENCYFLDVVMETPVMQTTHAFLVSQGRAPADVTAFKQLLYSIWFQLYKRLRGDRSTNSSGFEHVFVGETCEHDVTGFHNWIQFYLQEKAGQLDYRGFFRRGTTDEMEASPRLITLQFTWNKGSGKPIGSSFIGTSPEFELAMYTTMFLMSRKQALVRIKYYDVELVCYQHGEGIGSAFPKSKSD